MQKKKGIGNNKVYRIKIKEGEIIPKKKSNSKSNDMQKLLALIFAFSMVIGFMLVYYVNAQYENVDGNAILYRTDDTTEFPTLTFESHAQPYYDEFTTGLYQVKGTSYWNFSKTPVYLGDYTHTIAINSSDGSTNFAQYVIKIDNIDNWVINNITWNSTIPLDADLSEFVDIYALPIGESDIGLATHSYNLFTNYGLGGGTSIWRNRTLELSLSQAVNLYDISQNSDVYLVYQIQDKDHDGLSDFAFELSMEIEGKNVSTFNISEQLTIVLILSIAIKMVTVVYMTDSIDIGGFVNDIPDKRR